MTHSALIDCHVHFHPSYDVVRFLDSARRNFASAAESMGMKLGGAADTDGALGVLMLTECAHHHYFQKFSNGFVAGATDRWSIRATNEDCSLVACCDDEPMLILISGRQIITAENLEVLALGCNRAFPDGMPIEAVLPSVEASGAITVLPWGFGKWTGKRGRVIERVINSPVAERIFLGDNAGRPCCTANPALFKKATNKGIRILPGTDTLDFADEAARAGKYGIALTGTLTLDTPAADIKQMLQGTKLQPRAYGSRLGLMRFVKLQFALRMRKMKGKRKTEATTGGAANN